MDPNGQKSQSDYLDWINGAAPVEIVMAMVTLFTRAIIVIFILLGMVELVIVWQLYQLTSY